jgi:hypothetical protein
MCACSEEPAPKARAPEWNCDGYQHDFDAAFMNCVEKMRDAWGSEQAGRYSIPQCEDYAHKLFCKPLKHCEQEIKSDRYLRDPTCDKTCATLEATLEDEVKKLKRHRLAFCATLQGTCYELNGASGTDHFCSEACKIDGEDIALEVDKAMQAEKEP